MGRADVSVGAGDERLEHCIGQILLNALQVPWPLEQREVDAVGALQHLDIALGGERRCIGRGGSAREVVLEEVEVDGGGELMLETMRRDLELHRTDSCEDRRLIATEV